MLIMKQFNNIFFIFLNIYFMKLHKIINYLILFKLYMIFKKKLLILNY